MCMAATGTACRRLIYLWTRLQGAVCPLSIVLYFAAIYPRYPAARNTPNGHGFDLIGIPPLRGSLEAAPIAWVCGWTEVSLSPLPVVAVFAVPCKVQVLKVSENFKTKAIIMDLPKLSYCVRLCGLPFKAAEGRYPMCWIFGCQRATENLNLALWQPKEKIIILIPLRSQKKFRFTRFLPFSQLIAFTVVYYHGTFFITILHPSTIVLQGFLVF